MGREALVVHKDTRLTWDHTMVAGHWWETVWTHMWRVTSLPLPSLFLSNSHLFIHLPSFPSSFSSLSHVLLSVLHPASGIFPEWPQCEWEVSPAFTLCVLALCMFLIIPGNATAMAWLTSQEDNHSNKRLSAEMQPPATKRQALKDSTGRGPFPIYGQRAAAGKVCEPQVNSAL